MKKLKLFFACLLMAVLSIGQVWGAEDEVHKFNSSNETREVGLNNNAAIPAIEISAPAYPIKKVAVNCKYNKAGLPGVTISVTVGGEAFGDSYTFNTKETKTIDFTGASAASGDVVISFVNNSGTGTGKGTFYVYYVELTEGASGGTPTCATPTFNPNGATFYGESQSVELACATSGATIHYTLDGSNPTASSPTYSEALSLTATTTVKALAVKEGSNDSEIASATFTKGEAVTSYAINFETNNLDAYVNWDFVNIGIKSTTITAHGGTYYGANINGDGNGVATASITTKAKYANPGTLTFYISKESGNTTASSWKAQVSEDGEAWTDVETFDAKGMGKGEWNECTADLSSYSNVYVRISYGSSSAIRAIDDIELAAASATPKAAKPTFETGDDFVTSTSVTLACATEGANIYYTTNGDVPTSASELYDGAIPVSTTTTIKAIAVADGYDNSAVAEKTFTKVEALESLAALLSATTSTETAFNVVIDNWVVTGVQGTRAWIADAANEKGILLYKSGHNFVAGNKLNGVVIGTKSKLYQGYPELTTLVSTDVTVTTAAAITPRTTTIAALTSGYNAEQGTVVKLENLTYTAASTSFSDGENTIQADNKLYSASFVDGATYNLTGVVEYLDGSVIKIMPRSADDVEQTSGGGLPEVTGLAALKAEAVNNSYLVTLTDAIVTLVDGNNAFIEEENAGALIYFSGHGLAAGDKLNGQYEVTTATYNGKFEITAMTAQAGAETTHNAEIPVTTLTIAQLNANFAANESRRIKVVGANVTDAIGTSDRNGEISDGANIILYAGKNGVTAALNDNIDVIGYPTFYIKDETNQQQLAVWAQADITVNEKDPAGIAYTPESETITAGDDWSAPTFANPNNLDVDFSSDDETVATVSNTGVVSLEGGYGTAVITAHTDGDATHNAGNATYTITVNDPASVDTRHVAESPEGGFVNMISGDLSGNEISFAAYQGGAATAPNGSNTAHELRLYKYQETTDYGGYVTITAKTGCTIDQVVITVSANCKVGYCKDAESLPTKEDTPISIGTSSPFDTGIGLNASSVNVVNLDGSNQFKIKTITVYYTGEAVTLQSIAISGTASVLEYNDGDEFNPAGLVVTGTYSDASTAPIADGIIWAFDPATLSEGDESVSVTATVGEISSSAFEVSGLTVSGAAPALTDYYQKVTETAGITEGTYLIVYEGENVAFNGGLETLDAVSNTIEVAITSDHKIGVTSATEAATVYIDPTAGTIQAANGKYIGVTSNSNGLKQSDNASAYNNSFAIDGDGNAAIGAVFEGSTMTLRYNTDAGQKRFRYFKTTGSPAGQLYKLANEVIKPAAGLAWDPAEDITLTVGDAFTAPTLLNPNSIDAAEITIESSNPAVATVTAGVVELVADATGTTTITATFAGNASYKPATVSYKIKVNPAHSIYVSPSLTVDFGSVVKDASVDDKVITVTLTGVDAATATLAGDGASAFEFTPAALTASGNITISASSATAGTFAATLTISDDAGLAASKVVNLSLTVTDPAAEETPISTSTKWVVATAADLVDGAEVIITGVKNEVVYAMGEQKSTNRAGYAASVDGEGVLTPGEGTMAFTLVAQDGGTYALRTSDGKYLYAAGDGANHLKTQAEVDVNAKWTLAVNSAVAEGSTNRNIMRFNGSGTNNLFSCYSTGQTEIKFYVPKPVVTYVAQIGETMYESLPAAVAAAQDGQTVELLMDVAAGPGVMITSAEHKQIIIDFGNHTYCATSPVGSAGTENQAFHFEKGCNITLQNGTITSSGDEIIMLIQNYGDLTLLNITLIGNNLPGEHRYVLSNNCGTVVIGDGTTITAKPGDVAFNVCVTNDYPEGTQVTVKGGATITGIVEYGVWGTIPADNKATLTIEGGNFNVTWNVDPALAEDAKDNINVSGGIFNAEVPADYCAHGYIPEDNGSGQYGVYYAGYYERGSLTPGNYATICLPYAGKISGAKLFDLEYYDGVSTLYLLEVNGNAMVAGRPYIFLPSSDKIEVTYTDNAGAEAGSFNGLVGSLSLVAEEIEANAENYILYNNQYWLVNSKAYVGANRAYIHMDGVPTEPSTPQVGQAPRRRVAMAVNGKQTTTGIDALNATEAPVKMIIDGQIFILRGEKMYDTTGRLVK